MLNGETVVATLRELLKKTDVSEKQLRDVTEHAHRVMMCGGEFPSQLVVAALMGGLRARRPKAVEPCLSCIQHLFQARSIYPQRVLNGECAQLFLSPSSAPPRLTLATSTMFSSVAVAAIPSKRITIGALLVECLTEIVVAPGVDAPAQQKALELLHLVCQLDRNDLPQPFSLGPGRAADTAVHGDLGIASAMPSNESQAACFASPAAVVASPAEADEDPFGLYGTRLYLAIDACCRASITTASHTTVQIAATGLQTTLLRRAVRKFIMSATSAPGSVTGGGLMIYGPPLTDTVTDINFATDGYAHVSIVAAASAAHAAAATVVVADKESETQRRKSIDQYRAMVGDDQYSSLRDMIAVVKALCFAAGRTALAGADESSEMYRWRMLGIKLLFTLFEELPLANGDSEHRCAHWLSLMLESCKFELLKVCCRNVATIYPPAPFHSVLDLLRLLMTKCHYHICDELHSLLNVVLLPLMSSRLSNAAQKISFLHMLRSVLSSPALVVSLFINYDCNPSFDSGYRHGGFLESMLEVVTDMSYVNYVEDDWVTSDQQTMIRCEIIRIMHAFVLSLKRWAYDDPREFSKQLDAEAIGGMTKNLAVPVSGDGVVGGRQAVATELHLDDQSSDLSSVESDFAEDESTSGDVTIMDDEPTKDSLCASSFQPSFGHVPVTCDVPSTAGAQSQPLHMFGTRKHPMCYHWKHVHQLLCNKRIVQEGVNHLNVNWRRGRAYLVEHRLLNSDDDHAAFARFLRYQEGVDKKVLCAIFERVTKEQECARILEHYLKTFQYRQVPIDIALRDTTCEFMSWDRPQFEAQVWERIQELFGAEYALQNGDAISARDADVMAGVLLFLHTSVHNANVKQRSKMTAAQFLRDGSACMETPLPATAMQEMYDRVSSSRWCLDKYGRTPRQQDAAAARMRSALARRVMPWLLSSTAFPPPGAPPLSARAVTLAANPNKQIADDSPLVPSVSSIAEPSQGSVFDSSTAPHNAPAGSAATGSSGDAEGSGNFMAERSQSAVAPDGFGSLSFTIAPVNTPANEMLFESIFDSYTDAVERVRHKLEREQQFAKAARQQLVAVEAEHRRLMGRDEQAKQPYLPPHYAQHIRPMFLAFYPSVVAVCYAGLRTLKDEPILRLVLDIYQNVYDVAAAFCINMSPLQGAADRLIQRCLRQENAVELRPDEIRTTITSFLMNRF